MVGRIDEIKVMSSDEKRLNVPGGERFRCHSSLKDVLSCLDYYVLHVYACGKKDWIIVFF